MPNPRAQQNPSFFSPGGLQGLADMGRGVARGAIAEGVGGFSDMAQQLKDIRAGGMVPAMLARTLAQTPTSEELSHYLRGMTPNPLTQPDRAHTAAMGQAMGSIPAGMAAGAAAPKAGNALQKMMSDFGRMKKAQNVMPSAPPPAAEILKGPDPDLMRVYSGQRIPIEGKFDIMRADPHASMGRAFYTAELPRYANKFTGNQPGANVVPVDVDRNKMLMFDKTYDTPQGQIEGLDYYDMLRRQAIAKPGVGKDMIRQEILDAGFAGTQMPNATGKAYAIYDPSVAQDMSGRSFKNGGVVDVPKMAFGGIFGKRIPLPKTQPSGTTNTYTGINPMATGLGEMLQQSQERNLESGRLSDLRNAQFAGQPAAMQQRRQQLADLKNTRLDNLAKQMSTYKPPAGANGGLVMEEGNRIQANMIGQSMDNAGVPHMAQGGLARMQVGGASPKLKRSVEEATDFLMNKIYGTKAPRPLIDEALSVGLKKELVRSPEELNEILSRLDDPVRVAPAKAAVPFDIPRAAPKTDAEIRAMAERVARQQTGEFVKGKKTDNLAGRSKAEVNRLSNLSYDLQTHKNLPPVEVVDPSHGDILATTPGDQSVSDAILLRVGSDPIGSLQQGGSRYGLGQLDRPSSLMAGWKSNLSASRATQNRIDRAADYYDPVRVLGTYYGMGTDAMNFAQHFADANLLAIRNRINNDRMSPDQINEFNELIRKGFKKKDKVVGPFPDFPGIENTEDAYIYMLNNSEARKWFNNRMKTPAVTKKLNMPDGKEIEWAISEPELRNLEPFTTGHSIVQYRPNEPIFRDVGHGTYTHGIPGTFLGRQEVMTPFQLSYPDAYQFLKKNYKPSDVMTTSQKVPQIQVVDQQWLDEYGKYKDYLRQMRGYKKGGKVKKMQAGGIAKAVEAGIQAIGKGGKKTITSAVDPSTDLLTRLQEGDRTTILPMPNRWFLDPKNNPGVQKMVEKVLQVNNMQRSDFPSGAFVNPRTGEILDRKVMEDVGVVINPNTGRPVMSATKEVDTVLGDRKKGKITKSNLVRKQLYDPEGDQLLKDVDFIATIEQGGMGHKYGLGMEYANPTMMYNTMSGDNPTLRPKSQGDVFGIGDIVGRVLMKSSGMPHDVYESLFVAPKGSDVPGVKLSKKKGGRVNKRGSR